MPTAAEKKYQKQVDDLTDECQRVFLGEGGLVERIVKIEKHIRAWCILLTDDSVTANFYEYIRTNTIIPGHTCARYRLTISDKSVGDAYWDIRIN